MTIIVINPKTRNRNVCQPINFMIKKQVQRLNLVKVFCLTVLELVGDFENVDVFGTMPVVSSGVVMFVATMMNGDYQP